VRAGTVLLLSGFIPLRAPCAKFPSLARFSAFPSGRPCSLIGSIFIFIPYSSASAPFSAGYWTPFQCLLRQSVMHEPVSNGPFIKRIYFQVPWLSLIKRKHGFSRKRYINCFSSIRCILSFFNLFSNHLILDFILDCFSYASLPKDHSTEVTDLLFHEGRSVPTPQETLSLSLAVQPLWTLAAFSVS
jgi:hypothetical protein